ncbi:hypothetical protein THIX_50034 [Thiomonas sp. X19]|nr:hypothetical protein THIX_50014 [Thiomonas sp. X19]SCC93848.1 hypothetical protein THIX_50034 [Thiomonas sp. X19]
MFHRSYISMKPVVPSTVPYPDMRGWQRPGVKLRRQRSHRVIGTCGREAKRKLPALRR